MTAKLTFAGFPIVWDEAKPDGVLYLIGPKAIENLQRAGVLDEWLAEGLLKIVNLAEPAR